MRRLLPLLGLAIGALGAVAAADAPHHAPLTLYAHWPATWDEATAAPVLLDSVYPVREPDLAEGPLAPSASATGGLPRVTFSLVDFVGNKGPARTMPLDTSQPARFLVTLSSDAASPDVVVEATVSFGDEVVGAASTTVDLLPSALGAPMQDVLVAVPLNAARVLAGEGITLDLAIHQLDVVGERVLASGVRVHTGAEHPTSLALARAAEAPAPSHEHASSTSMVGAPVSESSADDQRRTIATIALVVSSTVALVSGAQLVRKLR